MTHTRYQIRAHIHENAGIHFNELVRETDFAPGQIQHHVRRLIDKDAVVRNEFYGRTHYYPPTYDEWERGTLALFRRETPREIILYLIENEPTEPGTVVAELGIARSTLEHHLDNLIEQDIIEKRYGLRNHVILSLSKPERTAHLLSAVTPTVPDRLVDRLTRLVDDLFDRSSGPQ